MHRIPACLIVLALCLGAAGQVSANQPTPDVSAGEAAYITSCARCHGVSGRGDGVDAKRFYPRPRDLSLGVFKFRSTASGTPPSDDDLFQTITKGLPGSNMPDWQHLDEQTRWQLVYYLKSLSPVFQQTQPAPVAVAPDPGAARVDKATGQALFTQLGCVACHGPSGRANGPSAAGLVDDWGMKLRPADLTQGWSYRAGSDPQAVMLRMLTGIDGAGMPSYAEALSPEDAWHLAYYVASLQEPGHFNPVAYPTRITGTLPSAVNDPRWATVERNDAPLRNVVHADGAWAEPPTVKAISFQVVYNDTGMAFRLTWNDPTQDPAVSQHGPLGRTDQAMSDGVALVLKPAGSEGDTLTLQAWPYDGAPALDLCYWSAGTGQAYETVTKEFDAVLARRAPQALLDSIAGYEDGRWQLVVQRPLVRTNPAGAAVIDVHGMTAIGFAVWDGGNPTARAVSPWVDLGLGVRPSTGKGKERH